MSSKAVDVSRSDIYTYQQVMIHGKWSYFTPEQWRDRLLVELYTSLVGQGLAPIEAPEFWWQQTFSPIGEMVYMVRVSTRAAPWKGVLEL